MKSVSLDELIQKYGSKDELVNITEEFAKNIKTLINNMSNLVDDFGSKMFGYTNMGLVVSFTLCDTQMSALIRGTDSGVYKATNFIYETLQKDIEVEDDDNN